MRLKRLPKNRSEDTHLGGSLDQEKLNARQVRRRRISIHYCGDLKSVLARPAQLH